MVAKWTFNLKQQKLSLARDAQQSADSHTAGYAPCARGLN